jgi:hypothetical protein
MENTLENSIKYAMNNPEPQEAKGDFLEPDSKPAMDDEATANLVTMFASVCKAFAIGPKDALSILSEQDWDDDNNIVTHIRTGF